MPGTSGGTYLDMDKKEEAMEYKRITSKGGVNIP